MFADTKFVPQSKSSDG